MAKQNKRNNNIINKNNHDDFINNDIGNYSSDFTEDKREEEYASLWCPICRDTTIFIDDVCTSCGFKKNKKANHTETDEGIEASDDSTQNLLEIDDDDLYLDLNNPYDESNDDF